MADATMPLDESERLDGMESVACGRVARSQPLAFAVAFVGNSFAQGRRTVTTWLRAAGISDDYQDYYYFLAALGRKTESVATQLVILIFGNCRCPIGCCWSSTIRRPSATDPHVEGADVHHNPTPGPADQPYLYGHVWVTISLALRHSKWGPLALPLRAML